MKRYLLLLPCALCLPILTSGCAGSGYKGPSLKFGIGYEGVEFSLTLISKTPITLEQAGKAFSALTAVTGPDGKAVIPTAALP
jgi:hypothetical protein